MKKVLTKKIAVLESYYCNKEIAQSFFHYILEELKNENGGICNETKESA